MSAVWRSRAVWRTARSLRRSRFSYREPYLVSLLLRRRPFVLASFCWFHPAFAWFDFDCRVPLPSSIHSTTPLFSCPKVHFFRRPLSPKRALIWDSHVSSSFIVARSLLMSHSLSALSSAFGNPKQQLFCLSLKQLHKIFCSSDFLIVWSRHADHVSLIK